MNRIALEKQVLIVSLRKLGRSIPEIAKEVGVSKTTVQRHVVNIVIPNQHLRRLKERQGGAKERAAGLRLNILEEAQEKLDVLSKRDMFILLVGLYWGEGTKRDFGMINSDPRLVQAFISCLEEIGIKKERLSLSLRLHSDISVIAAKRFWAEATGVNENLINRVEIVEGKKKGKLKFGMCRVRIRAGIRERLLIQAAIQLIGNECNKRIVSFPKPL